MSRQTRLWYRSSHLIHGKKANKYFTKCQTTPLMSPTLHGVVALSSTTLQLWKINFTWDTFFIFSLCVAGLRLPVYKAMTCKAPVLPPATMNAAEPKPVDIDVSDLGSRNYGARSDFYCLVTEEDIWSAENEHLHGYPPWHCFIFIHAIMLYILLFFCTVCS